jgi:hypothetical protein
MAAFDPVVPEYRYFVADLLTNAVIAEIPFSNVSYERAIKSAGSFNGDIPIIDRTAAWGIYESTMPGRTALYVVRNDQCVWGGIIWTRSYSLDTKSLSVSASEFTSYLHHRNIWKTYSHAYPCTLVVSGGVVYATLTSSAYAFTGEMPIKFGFSQNENIIYNGTYSIATSPSPTTTSFYTSATRDTGGDPLPNGTYLDATAYVRVDSYDYVRSLLEEVARDFSGITFPNTDIEPGVPTRLTVTHKRVTSGVATLTFSEPNDAIPGQTITVTNVGAPFDGVHIITGTTSTTVSFSVSSGNIANTAVSATTMVPANKTASSPDDPYYPVIVGRARLGVFPSHGLSVGAVINVSGVDDPAGTATIFDGTVKVTEVFDSTTFSYRAVSADAVAFSVFGLSADWGASPLITLTPQATYGTYGSYPGNSDIGLSYSTLEYSGKALANHAFRGYELTSVGEELDQYSDNINGFEYRIDCDYDPATNAFTRTFVMIPIDFPDPPPPGEVSPIERFGAQNLIFEYPGNILDVKMDESAESSATRFFIVGNIGDIGADASQPYAAAVASDLLALGWPILDQEESGTNLVKSESYSNTDTSNFVQPVQNNYLADEDTLYAYAQRYLNEFRPPVADITISVNGSVFPSIGTYLPGDWCCLIIQDDFVQMRLSSDLEPRDELLVRKIESYKVTVPDGLAFPERVDLTLISEWEVDKRG